MENYYNKAYSLNTSIINNNSYQKNNRKYQSIPEKESYYEKALLNSMKDSLNTFLLNLRTKSSSKNISYEDIQNYYLTENEKLNSLNIDLISPYQSLLQKNINKNNFSHNKKIKRAYSSGEMVNLKLYNNNNNNSFKMNSYIDKKISGLTQNNSSLYNDNNFNMNKSLTIKNYNNITNMNNNIYRNKKNKKFDYPIKLISKRNIKGDNNFKESKKNYFIKDKYNINKERILYIKNEFKKLKNKNKENKLEIIEFYEFHTQLINNILNKIISYIRNFENVKINNYKKEIISLKNKLNSFKSHNKSLINENNSYKDIISKNDKNKEKEEQNDYNRIIEENNNNIFL